MTIKNLFTTIKTFAKNNESVKIPVLFVVTFVGMVALATFAVAYANNQSYQTNISFVKKSYPLAIVQSKTEIVPGISSATLDDLNQNPNPDNIKAFMEAIAPEYGIDWKLVYAIGYHESGNYGSSLAQRNNNYFGRKASSSGYAAWATPEDGIRDEFEYLKTRYFDIGLTTPASINPVYAEDTSWHVAVESVMNSL